MSTYPGDTVTLPITYRVAGTLTDPTSVKMSVVDPLGETLETLDNVTRDSTGTYHYDYPFASTAITGNYVFTWTITVDTTVTTYTQIIELEVPPSGSYYADDDTIKEDLKGHSNDFTTDDSIITNAIAAAQRLVNGQLGITKSIPSSAYWGTDEDATDKWDILVQAANLYAKSCIMDDLFTTKDKRSPSAIEYEKQALIVLKPFTN
jgi:hypothetical protein